MDILTAIEKRHSVRQYKDIPIEPPLAEALLTEIDACNREGDMHFQPVLNEPRAFSGTLAYYGKFSGVSNYIALIGKKARIWRKNAATTVNVWCFAPNSWDSTPAGWPLPTKRFPKPFV